MVFGILNNFLRKLKKKKLQYKQYNGKIIFYSHLKFKLSLFKFT